MTCEPNNIILSVSTYYGRSYFFEEKTENDLYSFINASVFIYMSRWRMLITCDTSNIVTINLVPPQGGERNVDNKCLKTGLLYLFYALPCFIRPQFRVTVVHESQHFPHQAVVALQCCWVPGHPRVYFTHDVYGVVSAPVVVIAEKQIGV